MNYAAKYANLETIITLLKRGARLDIKNEVEVMPIDNIYAEDLEEHLDSCIKKRSFLFQECEESKVLTFDYTTLFSVKSSETEVILRIGKNPKLHHLLHHPIISTIFYLKCFKMKRLFRINCVFHSLFVAYLIGHICTERYTDNNYGFIYLLSITYVIFLIKEFLQMYLHTYDYIMDPENYLDIFILFSTGYYNEIFAAAIFSSSLKMMFLIARILHFSTYVSILKTVSWNFFKFVLWASILLVAFTFAFYVIYRKSYKNSTEHKNEKFFDNSISTYIKVIAMFSGELDTGSLLQDGNLSSLLDIIIFVFFNFFVTITLSNVINGLAVSDIQTIKAKAEILNVIERINRVAKLEMVLRDNNVLSKFLRIFVRDIMSIHDCSTCIWLNRKISMFSENRISIFSYTNGTHHHISMKLSASTCRIVNECGHYSPPQISFNRNIIRSTENIISRRSRK
nr:transient receptor potential cation channel protein painless-like [Onthophagus taurus]